MQYETMLTWSYLNILSKRRYDWLLSRYESLDDALEDLDVSLLEALRCRPDTIQETLKRLSEFDAAAYANQLDTKNISLLSLEDDEYPTLLKTIDDLPVFLYAQGSLDMADQPCVSLVGTRQMSNYGRRVTEHLVSDLVRAQVVTVSGLAYGIDAEVAKQTIANGGKTIAVLAHGLSTIYPKDNRALSEAILEADGLILSEFALDIRPDKFTFPARNRIIAGLGLATVVLEAAKESGSLITAELALDYNRSVFALPGDIFDPHYAGCHELISRSQATLITRAEDILIELGIHAPERTSVTPTFDSDDERCVYKSLTTLPQPTDDLMLATGLDAGLIAASLMILELKGSAKNAGEGRWVRA